MTGSQGDLGGLLAAHRRRVGLTQEELSERSSLSVRAISELESGRVLYPRPSTVGALVDALTLAPADRRALEHATRDNRSPGTGPWWWPDAPLLLPPADFTGRAFLLDMLRRHRRGVVVLHGAVGIGKTSLALHHAQRVAADFRDGAAYVSIGDGCGSEAVLKASRHPSSGQGPDELSLALAGRAALLLLDDVVSEDQVRAVVDAAPHCLVLITSRGELRGLPHVTHIEVGTMPESEALEVLCGVVGADRVNADPGAALDLARLCGGLPLALRAAANRLASRPHWPIRYLADKLRDRTKRWQVLDAADDRLATAMESAYHRLDDEAVRTFLGLGAHLPRPAELPDGLWHNGLVRRMPGGGYAVPDLVLAFAEVCVRRGKARADRQAAV